MSVRILTAAGLAVTAIGASLCAATAPALADDSAGPGKEHVAVNIADFNGRGCPADKTYIAQMFDDRSATISFKGLRADTRLGTKGYSSNCTVGVNLYYPQGWTYSTTSVEQFGTVDVEDGAAASLSTSYVRQNEADVTSWSKQYKGPLKDSLHVANERSSTVSIPCGDNTPRLLFITTNLTATPGPNGENAAIEVAETSVGATTKIHLNWTKCPKV